MLKSRSLLLMFFLLISFTWLFSSGVWKKTRASWASESPAPLQPANTFIKNMHQKAVDAKLYAQQKGYHETICLMADMSLPSGRDRLFVYDLGKDTIRNAGLVTHGRCNQYWLEGRKYGNSVGCGCTSLGKYKIGRSYQGRFGLAYKLHGLEKTNNKAFERFVVLHPHECVPATEVKEEICQSDGCPTVSPGFLQYLKPIIDAAKKPVLLWIYE